MPNLPKMVLTSVASSYENLHAYFGVFHPLMLLEQWEDICKCVLEHKNGPLKDYNALAHPQGKDEEHEGLTRVLFTVGVTNRREDALNISDLVLLKYTRKDEKKIVDEIAFGVVEKGPRNCWNNLRVNPKTPIDPRLLSGQAPRPETLQTYYLRLRNRTVPPSECRQQSITLQKVTSLRQFLRQMQVQAWLMKSPLTDIILKPTPEAFQLRRFNLATWERLNPSQTRALLSICETVVRTPEKESKICLMQGPPGTGKSHVIIEMILHILHEYHVLHNQYPRILICAPSNAAIDLLASRFKVERSRLQKECSSKFSHENVLPLFPSWSSLCFFFYPLVLRIGLQYSQANHDISLNVLTMERVFQECAMKEANDTSALPTSIRTDNGELEHIRKQEEILKSEIEELKVRDKNR